MKIILQISFTLIINCVYSQFEFFSNDETGHIYQSSLLTCCKKDLGVYPVFTDIALTPNGNLYGLNTTISKINLQNQSIDYSIIPLNESGNLITGTGLIAVDDTRLITDYLDSLYLIDVNTGIGVNLGFTGHLCAGDMAFLENKLYFTSSLNELVEIQLNSSDLTIVQVQIIGDITSQNLVYGLVSVQNNTSMLESGLYGVTGNQLIKFKKYSSEYDEICIQFESVVNGTSEVIQSQNKSYASEVNVLTPNNDGINDCFVFDNEITVETFTVLNRWGQTIIELNGSNSVWCGDDFKGTILNDGVYYYSIKYKTCNQIELKEKHGFVTVIK